MPELEAIAASMHDGPMPELEAIAAPTHDAPTLPLRGSTISESETRLRHPTPNDQVQNPEPSGSLQFRLRAGLGFHLQFESRIRNRESVLIFH